VAAAEVLGDAVHQVAGSPPAGTAAGGPPAETHAFGAGKPFSLGIEEELFLVDAASGRQRNSSEEVLARVGRHSGQVERELHACQVELISGVHRSAGAAVAELAGLRRAVLATGTGLLASGTHPAGGEGEAQITDRERYERIHELLGDAVATPVCGLHVHIGMPDPQTAITCFNGLRRHLPLLQALAANSPYRHGHDSGLASAREVTMRGWPRSGVPREMRDFDDFCATAELLARAADVPDYTWFWWKLRPHPRLGTVEVRALDVQSRHEDTATLAALVHCLARAAAEREPAGAGPPAEIIEEGSFRAARFGVTARLPDRQARLRPVSQLLEQALAEAEPHAGELGCEEELARLPALLDSGGGAGRQRAAFAAGGMDGLLAQLTSWTAPATGLKPSHGSS